MCVVGIAFAFQYSTLFANDYVLQFKGCVDLPACVLGVFPLFFLYKIASMLKGLLDARWMTAGVQMVL